MPSRYLSGVFGKRQPHPTARASSTPKDGPTESTSLLSSDSVDHDSAVSRLDLQPGADCGASIQRPETASDPSASTREMPDNDIASRVSNMPTGALPGGRHSRHLSAQSVATTSSLVSGKLQDETSNVSTLRFAALTCSILCVQIFFSIIMAHGTPYLHSLGLSSAFTSLVWMAGPLSGCLFQPIVGVWSDQYRPKQKGMFKSLGRRKPFIIIGAVGVGLSILALSIVRESFELVGMLVGYSQRQIDSFIGEQWHGSVLLALVAIFWVYCANIAIQPLQAGLRAYFIDSAPPHQQTQVNAWVSRWNCAGAVFAFYLGSVDLPHFVPFLGKSQFRTLCIVECAVIVITLPISFLADTGLGDRALNEDASCMSVKEIFRSLYQTYKTLPPTTWTVFKIQFWSWMAWFPFLYYNTAYIGSLTGDEPDSPTATHATGNELIKAAHHMMRRSHYSPTASGSDPDTVAAEVGSFASFIFSLTSLSFTILLPFLTHHIRFFTIPRLWFASHFVFAGIITSTIFVTDVPAGTALIACLGYSWAMTQWAPFALIAGEVSRAEAEEREDRETGWADGEARGMTGAGAVLGLHNVAIAGPQVVAALECAILFKVLGALVVEDELGSVLRWTGLAALGAAWACWQLIK